MRVVRFGRDDAIDGWICETRLRARRRVRRRGEYGKFESEEISLSVKSMASWSCLGEVSWLAGDLPTSHPAQSLRRIKRKTYPCNAQVFNGRNLMPYNIHIQENNPTISMELTCRT